MISLDLKNAYNNLDLENKKNKLSDELLVIEELVKTIENCLGMVPNFKIKNYELGSKLNEDDFLSFTYEDVFEIKRQLVLIIDKFNSNYGDK